MSIVAEGHTLAGPVRVAIYGFGRVGPATLELALTRPWIDVVGIFAASARRRGERASDAVPSAPTDLLVSADAAGELAALCPDVVIVATRSRLVDVLPQLRIAAASGARAILCTAEELAYARIEDGPEARAVHELAEDHGVAIVATGLNPGFVLDLLPLVLCGMAWDVEAIRAKRVVDGSVFAPQARSRLGIGHTPDTFAKGVVDGSVVGHLGFRESLRILTDTLGKPAERITISTDPLIAEQDHELPDGRVSTGMTIGASQRAEAWVAGRPWISIELIVHGAPATYGYRTIDETHVVGRHELHATVEPGCGPLLGTAALLVNGIPRALDASPGLYGPGELLATVPWLGHGSPPGVHIRPRPPDTAYG